MAIWDIKERNNLVRKNTASRGAQLGLFAGGATPSNVGVVDRINVNNRGDATDFGDLVRGNQCGCGFGSSTRGINMQVKIRQIMLNNIDYVNGLHKEILQILEISLNLEVLELVTRNNIR